ncbi:Ig-like domain-containing protein [Chryseobacterium sp. Leaf394]|uniref:Ig-like domain-containing protein n=1 Tax=Chryseobacterium sp. Leaf394 TaxID=1736361 RepID=UPI000AE174C4|nr:Ig-like domain-containing protein [Chryseobacterium sp. Leaf394]
MILKIEKLFFSILLLSCSLILAQTVPSSSATANCSTCVPTGWTNGSGTPDISSTTIAADTNTAGGGAAWTNNINGTGTVVTLPNAPNGNTRWISIRDVGTAGQEESLSTTLGSLVIGRQYEVIVYALTATTNATGNGGAYAGRYIDFFSYQIGANPVQNVSSVPVRTWGTFRFRFTAPATTQTLVFRPGTNSAATSTSAANLLLFETVQLSVTANAINAVPVAVADNTSTLQGIPVSLNVAVNDSDPDGLVNPNTVDLDPSTPAVETTLNTAQGTWSVANGVVTFTPVPTFTGVATIPYTIKDNYILDGASNPSTSNPVNISVTVLADSTDSDGDGIPNRLDLDDDNDGILDTVENNCTTRTEGTPVFSNDFGTNAVSATAPLTSPDNNVQLHTQVITDPQDGSYAITTSNARSATYTKTNLSPTLNKDAGYNDITAGSVNGRYLMINVGSAASLNQPIYRVTNLAVVPGRNYRFRIDMAGLADNLADIPRLQLVIRDATNAVLATTNSSLSGMANDDVWRRISMEFTATTGTVTIEIVNQQGSGSSGNDLGIDNIVLAPFGCDADADGIPNSLDADSDNDGCADALEGTEVVRYNQIYPLNHPTPALRGQIRVIYDGVTTGTPTGIISTSASANGVPQLVNNAGNNLNAATNPSNLAGLADNTDIPAPLTADIGQEIGTSQNALTTDAECSRCFRPASTATGIDVSHGFTSLNRAGTNGNWPMKIKSAHTVLDSRSTGFVINRLTTAQVNAITTAGNAVIGMAVYDTTENCLKIYDGTGWFCYTRQTCDNFNQ